MPLSEREMAILADLERSFERAEGLVKRTQNAFAKQPRLTLLVASVTAYLVGTAVLVVTFTHVLVLALLGLAIMFCSLLGFVHVMTTRRKTPNQPR